MLVSNGLVQDVSPNISKTEASHVVDVGGLWLTPGFIDPHSHADSAVLTGENMEIRAQAGVTTEIVGQDGLGLAHASYSEEFMSQLLTPIAGDLDDLFCEDVDHYLRRVDEAAYARTATLTPHGTLRSRVMGRDLIDSTPDDRKKMAQLFMRDLQKGSLGLSTGLSYPPALASSTSELVHLMSHAPKKTPYVSHLRSYGVGFGAAVEEALEIGKSSGCHVHFSHFHVSSAGDRGKAFKYLETLDQSNLCPTIDTYPYTHACTFLMSLLPDHLKDLPPGKLKQLISENRTELAEQMLVDGPQETIATGWNELIVKGLQGFFDKYEGHALRQIAHDQKTSTTEAVLNLILHQSSSPMVLVPQGNWPNILTISAWHAQVVGSDGIFGSGVPHPRLVGSFLRFLALVRNGNIPLALEEAVARMSSRTARILGLRTGELKSGYPADINVINPDAVSIGLDTDLGAPPAIVHTLIGGMFVLRDCRWQARTAPGLALRVPRS